MKWHDRHESGEWEWWDYAVEGHNPHDGVVDGITIFRHDSGRTEFYLYEDEDNDGEHHEFPSQDMTLEEMKAYALAMWRMGL
jgi:hypothetical protein